MKDSQSKIDANATGLPIAQDRARALAFKIGETLSGDDESLLGIIELLLGVAPFWTDARDAPSGRTFESDLWGRYCAVIDAVEPLYLYTTEHNNHFAKRLREIRRNHDTDSGERITEGDKYTREGKP